MKKKLPWGEVGFLTVIVLCIAYYFFLVAGALLCVFFIAVELVRNPSAEVEAGQTATEKKTLGDWFKANSPIFVIIASLLCYALLLKTLGLHLCNFLLSFFLVYYLSKGKWKTALITAVCITLAFYLVFDLSLGLRLPKGKLFKLLKLL